MPPKNSSEGRQVLTENSALLFDTGMRKNYFKILIHESLSEKQIQYTFTYWFNLQNWTWIKRIASLINHDQTIPFPKGLQVVKLRVWTIIYKPKMWGKMIFWKKKLLVKYNNYKKPTQIWTVDIKIKLKTMDKQKFYIITWNRCTNLMWIKIKEASSLI